MKLSVLVPTYKRPEVLRRNLQSLVSAKVNAGEVLVGDDGGDPETSAVCTGFAGQLPLRRLPPAGKGSLASNLTRLCDEAQGEWILLLHDDDFLTGDHSACPKSFEDACDLFFTDHWVADDSGTILKKETEENTRHYGRDRLQPGPQRNPVAIGLNQSICLDGFYIRRSSLGSTRPDRTGGRVADFFWMLRLLAQDIRVSYSPERTFAYMLSPDGLTALGLSEDTAAGYRTMVETTTDPALKREFRQRLSRSTWHAVNDCLRRGDRRKAWQLLRSINFNYTHSLKHKLLIVVQLTLLALPFKLLK